MTPAPSLYQLFEQQVAIAPSAPAVRDGEKTLSYAELNSRASALASSLRAQGVGPEVLVGLSTARSVDLFVGLLAILKAGGVYVPFDPDYPDERLLYLLRDSGVRTLVGSESTRDRIVALAPQLKFVLATDSVGTACSAQPSTRSCAAYVIYTSGSTGKPKGVVVEHGNVLRLFEQLNSRFEFRSDDIWAMFHSYSFDFSVWEIWGALLHGGLVILVPNAVREDPAEFQRLLVRERVTMLSQTPSAFRQLVRADQTLEEPSDYSIRHVFFGGEALDVGMLRPWIARYGDQDPILTNLFGITETTVHVTHRRIRELDLGKPGQSPIGRPIADLSIYLLDPSGEPSDVGAVGEMYVGGAGVARGYLNQAELTSHRFRVDPFSSEANARMYRTGDLARRTPEGEFLYEGRADVQLQVRGHRVEPGEVEACLLDGPELIAAAVVAQDYGEGDVRLIAHVCVASAEVRADWMKAVVQRATAFLPKHQRPSAYRLRERLPLTAHGKIDRRALAADRSADANSMVAVDPMTQLWLEVLRVPSVSPEDDFFERGGTSLSMIRLLRLVRRRMGVELRVADMMSDTTLGAFQRHVRLAASCEAPGCSSPLVRTARELLTMRSLLGSRPPGVRIQLSTESVALGAKAWLPPLAEALNLPRPEVTSSPSGLTSFDIAISRGLRTLADSDKVSTPFFSQSEVLAAAEQAKAKDPLGVTVSVSATDGAEFRVCARGEKGKQAIVIASACGMPLEMSSRWISTLSDRFYVITLETRGLRQSVAEFDRIDCSLDAQARDLLLALDSLSVNSAHVMGFCGGALVALRAAALAPEKLLSLSLWHGDYTGLGGEVPSSSHQQMAADLMEMCGEDRDEASDLHLLFQRPTTLDRLSREHAHWLLYPFATGETLYRYGRLNGSLMTAPVRSLLTAVSQRVLVVTSETDTTTHPAGSRHVASQLTRGRLHVEPTGDHLSLFGASTRLVALLEGFLQNTGNSSEG